MRISKELNGTMDIYYIFFIYFLFFLLYNFIFIYFYIYYIIKYNGKLFKKKLLKKTIIFFLMSHT